VVDEAALTDVLENHRISGAALDVFRQEPLPAGNPLANMKNVILSPHCAGSTWESNVRIALAAAQAVLDVLEGRRPPVNFIYNK
jgi:D-3-phosphoglycerate dehydrogenase